VFFGTFCANDSLDEKNTVASTASYRQHQVTRTGYFLHGIFRVECGFVRFSPNGTPVMRARNFLMAVAATATVFLPRSALPAEPTDRPKDSPSAPARHSLFPEGQAHPPKVPKALPTPPAKPPSGPQTIQQEHPKFFVHANVDHPTRQYEEGDSLVVSVTSEADAYVHIIYRQADGKVYQIFPNSGQRDNRIQARQTLQFPVADGLFRWIVGPPFGKELIKVIASQEPLGRLSEAQLEQVRFNPVSDKDIETTRLELGQKKEPWTEDHVEITTIARGQAPAPAAGRRFAVFSAVSKYEFNDVLVARKKVLLKRANKWQEGNPPPHCMNIASPAINAELMEKLFRRYGQLTDARRHVNEEATRQGLKESVEWLKEVSHPGDTVFIYHCGHGGRFPDDLRDDDKLPPGVKPCYVLMPYEYADFGVIDGLLMLKNAGSLDAALEPRLKHMFLTAFPDRKLPEASDKAAWLAVSERMVKEFCVTADEFGHWIQMLDGRQVVVILETCHAGGFATREAEGEKGIDGDKGLDFDFLGSQLGRLKDIGQPESALLAACAAHETAIGNFIPDDELQWMIDNHKRVPRHNLMIGLTTEYFYEAMLGHPSPLRLDASFEQWLQERAQRHCELLHQAFQRPPDTKPDTMRPRLFNYCSRVIVLKP
jgi:hypothetical protein